MSEEYLVASEMTNRVSWVYIPYSNSTVSGTSRNIVTIRMEINNLFEN